MVCALVGTVLLWFDVDFTFDKKTKVFVGANIDHAIRIAFLGVLLGLVFIGFARRRPPLLCALLLIEAAILAGAVTLVGLDGGTYRARFECEFLCFAPPDVYTSRTHVTFPYVLWGIPIGVLLLQAVRAWKEGPPEPPKSRYEQPGWLQQPPAGAQ